MKGSRQERAKSYLRFQLSEGHFVLEGPIMPVRRHRPLHTPAPCSLELDPHQIAITRLLACIVTFTNVLVLPRHVRRQNATPTAYPIPGNLIRHSG